jgi:hypothetical protein
VAVHENEYQNDFKFFLIKIKNYFGFEEKTQVEFLFAEL